MNPHFLWRGRHTAALLLCVVVAILIASNTGVREIRRAQEPLNFVLVSPQPGRDDWPCWRGAFGTNAVPDSSPPLHWSASENLAWQVSLPGSGHGSPCVWGERLFAVTADDARKTITLLCLDRDSGRTLWQSELHRGELGERHVKNTHASATPACDGRQVFVTSAVNGSLWVTAVDLAGRIVWQRATGPYQSRWGYGASPTIYQSLVIVAAESEGGQLDRLAGASHLTALHRQTGEIVWRIARPVGDSFGTPIVATVSGRDQLLLAGKGAVTSCNPANGDVLWTCRWSAQRAANTLAFDDEHVFASARHPQGELLCIRADGRGDVTSTHIVWREKTSASEVPSPVLHDGLLYSLGDEGVLTCLEATTGKVIWKRRLGGTMTASPLLAGGYLYCCNEEGITFVVKLGGRGEVVAENALGDGLFASPIVSGDRLYLRTRKGMHCLSEPNNAPLADRQDATKQRL